MQHIRSLTEQWREMASLLGYTKILFEHHTDLSVNKLTTYFTTANA